MGLFDFFKKKEAPQPEPVVERIPPEALMVWVHRTTHFEAMRELQEQQDGEFRFLRLSDVISATPALATNEGPISCTPERLAALGLSFEEAFTRASQNSHAAATQPLVAEGKVVIWTIDAAVTLLGGLKQHLPFRGQVVAMHAAADFVLAASADDVDALALMLKLAVTRYDESAEWRTLRALTWLGDSIIPTEWLPPEGHPLRADFARAAGRTRVREAQSQHAIFDVGDDGAPRAPLASLAVRPSDGKLIASWARGTTVLVPTDVAELHLFDLAPTGRVASTLAGVSLACGEPLGLGRVETGAQSRHVLSLLEAESFPTDTDLRFLAQHDANAAEMPVDGAALLAAIDAGEPVIAQPVGSDGAHAKLLAPDGRRAVVASSEVVPRLQHRSARDHHRFASDCVAHQLLAGLEPALDALPPEPSDPRLFDDAALDRLFAERGEPAEGDLGGTAISLRLQMLVPASLMPIIRPPGFDDANVVQLKATVAAAAPGATLNPIAGRCGRPLPGGLRADLVQDSPSQVIPLNDGDLPPTMLEAAWRTAQLHLEASAVGGIESVAPGVYSLPTRDTYDASRAFLVPRLFSSAAVKGTPLVFVPHLTRVWLTGSDDLEGITFVLDQIDALLASDDLTSPYAFRELVPGEPWTLQNDALVPSRLPAGHPCEERLAALLDTIDRRRHDSSANIGAFTHAIHQPLQPSGPAPRA